MLEGEDVLRIVPVVLFVGLLACARPTSFPPGDELAAACNQVDAIPSVERLIEYLGEPLDTGVDKRVTVHGTGHRVEYHGARFEGARAHWAIAEALGDRFVLQSVELTSDRGTMHAHAWLGLSRAELTARLGAPVAEASDVLSFSCPPVGDPTTDVAIQLDARTASAVVFHLYFD